MRRVVVALALGTALALGAALAAALGGCGQARPGAAVAGAHLPGSAGASSRIVVIVMENREFTEVIGDPQAPYVNSLARQYALATRSYAVSHPSLPNYLALTSGSTHGIESDCTSCRVSGPSIADQLERAGITWKAYLEGIPRPCWSGAAAGGYARKHDPFAYYESSAGRHPCRLVGFDALASDLRSASLPTFSWITPNLCDDGHDCGLAAADHFLARTVPALLRDLGPHGLLVVTWDEGASDRGCCAAASGGRIATILAGPDARRGARSDTPVDHYGVLASIEEALRLPLLGAAADSRSGRLDALLAQPLPIR